jgi:hypothetical protein
MGSWAIEMLAEMREHPGGSVRRMAMFAAVQTGRPAPNRFFVFGDCFCLTVYG